MPAPSGSSRRALDRRPCATRQADLGDRDRRRRPARRRRPDAAARDAAARLPRARRRAAPLGRDPRVDAAFQYTFRDDPAFPVGLADAGLTRTWPAYDLWLAWGGDRAPGAPAPDLPAACAAGADSGA